MKKIIIEIIVVFFLLTTLASAETVYVKYRGNVNLDEFQCVYTSSSFVHRICYQEENSYLIVLLNNTYYHYCGVPNFIFNNWINASSKGRFYNSYIKGNFYCR